MRTAKAERTAAMLSVEKQLSELLQANNTIDDAEIEKRLQLLNSIDHTAEELAEKERLEKIVEDAEIKLADVSKQMTALKGKYVSDHHYVPGEAVDDYKKLKEERADINNVIKNTIEEIREISAGKLLNRKNHNDYMIEYAASYNRVAELEKTMKNCEAACNLSGYEDARKKYFEEKLKLKTLEQNKPEKLNEDPDAVQAQKTLQKEIRKNVLVKILFYSDLIEKAISEARRVELEAIDAAAEHSWIHYRKTGKQMFDETYWVNSFYAGIKNPYNTTRIKDLLSELKK